MTCIKILFIRRKQKNVLWHFFFTQAPKVFIDEKRIHKKKVATSQTETCFTRLYLNTTSVITRLECQARCLFDLKKLIVQIILRISFPLKLKFNKKNIFLKVHK
jgi:hypothetical protein